MDDNGDKSEKMKRFLHAMDTNDYETAASLFDDGAVLVIAPFVPREAGFATGVEETEGIDAIRAKWAKRDKKTHHTLNAVSVSGSEWFGEGFITLEDSETRLFLAHATFGPDGKVQRFAALR